MDAGTDLAPRCDHTIGCITCGDEAVAMRVVEVDEASGLALCTAPERTSETVEVALVEPVTSGDSVLVHAGVALQRLDTETLA